MVAYWGENVALEGGKTYLKSSEIFSFLELWELSQEVCIWAEDISQLFRYYNREIV